MKYTFDDNCSIVASETITNWIKYQAIRNHFQKILFDRSQFEPLDE